MYIFLYTSQHNHKKIDSGGEQVRDCEKANENRKKEQLSRRVKEEKRGRKSKAYQHVSNLTSLKLHRRVIHLKSEQAQFQSQVS